MYGTTINDENEINIKEIENTQKNCNNNKCDSKRNYTEISSIRKLRPCRVII